MLGEYMSDNAQGAASAAPVVSPVTEATENTELQSQEVEGDETEVAVPEITKAEKKRLKKLMLKVDGEEFEEELPFEIDEEHGDYVRKQLQLAKMSQKRAQYASQIEKEAFDLIEMLRKDPRRVLSDPTIGIDIKEFAAKIIEEEIENARKSPEQIEREKMENELRALKEEREKEKEAHRKRELERLQEQEYERYDTLMTQALEKNTDIPKSAYVVKKMADHMIMALEKGYDVTPEELIPLIREEMREDVKQMFQVLPEDVIEQLVGKDNINKIRKKYVSKGKEIKNNALANPVPKKDKVDANAPKQTYKDFFKL